MVIVKLAWPSPVLATVGVLLVGVGSAMQCAVTAGRVVQSLAVEEVVPGLKRVGVDRVGADGVARRAVGVTLVGAGCLVAVRRLEFLAGVVSMAFLVGRLFH